MSVYRRFVICFMLATLSIALSCNLFIAKAEESPKKTIDGFDQLSGWNAIRPPEAELNLTLEPGLQGNSLCLDYDLSEKKLYVVVSRDVFITLPPNYEFSFYIKGVSPRNNLEFKIVDANGNTFLKRWENYKFNENWKEIKVRKKDMPFGWGPDPKAKLEEAKKIEFAVVSGKGGKGKIFIDELSLTELPPEPEEPPLELKAEASSVQMKDTDWCKAENAIDGNMTTRWSSDFSDPQWLLLDMGKPQEIAGVTLYWEIAFGKAYDILISEDGKDWLKAYSTEESDGGTDEIYFKKSKARFLKIYGRQRGSDCGYSLWEAAVKRSKEEPLVTASSFRDNDPPDRIMDGNIKDMWHSKGDGEEKIEVDFRDSKKLAGFLITWDDDYAVSYDVEVSEDGQNWETICSFNDGNGGKDKIYFPPTEIRFARLLCKKSNRQNGYGIKEIEIRGPEPLTLQRYYEIAAEESPKGYYPRWLTKEQAFWTTIGVADDEREFILCEDGTIEPHKRGFIIMPFLYLDGKLVTREDAKVAQSLEKDYLPIPSVEWDYNDLKMVLKMFAYGEVGNSAAYAHYTVRNNGKERVKGKLFLAIRPFQLYPPWQGEGGSSDINSIKYENDIITINGLQKILLFSKPDGFGVKNESFEIPRPPEGDIISFIRKGCLPELRSGESDEGNASAGIEYDFELKKGDSKDYYLAVPLYNKDIGIKPGIKADRIRSDYEKMLTKTAAFWEKEINKVDIDIPETAMVNTVKANIAYILITKDGPALQPGSRCYDKAWIRDGGITAVTLLRLGFTKEAKEFLDWYTSYQFPDGRIVCVIDNKAKDPFWEKIDEYDCQGEYLYTMLNYYYYTKDRKYLEEKLPNITKAMDFLVKMRNSRLTPEYRDSPSKKRYYGIIPNSYGMHYYWDDFWSLKGWKDGEKIARILGREDLARQAAEEYEALKKSVYESLDLVIKEEGLDYIPEYAEKGHLWPPSIAGGVMYCEETANMPQPQLKNTFDKYYQELESRLRPGAAYRFTPYEVRIAEAFIYMDQKERALKLLRFMLDSRKPAGWNQFTEVVNSPERTPTIFGDMPHTWVGAEYINAVRSLFLYEMEDRIILGHGIDEDWLNRIKGIKIERFPTWYGNINYSVRKLGASVNIKVWGDAVPPKGFLLKSPLKKVIRKVKMDGKEWKDFDDDGIRFSKVPASIVIYYGQEKKKGGTDE